MKQITSLFKESFDLFSQSALNFSKNQLNMHNIRESNDRYFKAGKEEVL